MTEQIPTITKGVVINADGTSAYADFPLPAVTDDKVLVKVHSGIINPSDIFCVAGVYPSGKNKPTTLGFEGSGVVIKAGKNFEALMGKRVGFISMAPEDTGSYGEYSVLSGAGCIPLPENVSLEEGAGCFVNPWTALMFIMIAKKKNVDCIVHTGAAGSLGKFLVTLCNKEGIKLINVVRREEQVTLLKGLGAQFVLNSSLDSFDADMKAMFAELNPQMFFDCVTGPMGSRIVAAMPAGSTTWAYGALDMTPYSLSSADMIFSNKTVRGFWLSTYLQKNPAAALELGKLLMENLSCGDYKVSVWKRFALADFQKAIEFYQANQTKGKVLLQANPEA